jgi:hypothetical protein
MFAILSKKTWTIVAVLASLSGVAGCATSQSLQVNPSGYRIIPAPESQTAYLATARSFQWVDSDRLLFLANDRQLSQHGDRGGRNVVIKSVPTIHLWDIKSGTLRRYRDEPLANHLCAVDGQVWYGLERKVGQVVFEGAFGKERERAPTPTRTSSDGRQVYPQLNRFTCKEYWFASLPRRNGGLVIPLRDEHGFLERIGSNSLGQFEWEGQLPPFMRWNHQGNTSRVVDLGQDLIGPPITYSHMLRGYVFKRIDTKYRFERINRVYLWLPATNSVRVLDVPGTQQWKDIYDIGATQEGLIVRSTATPAKQRSKWDPGPAGVYLIRGSLIDRFIPEPTNMAQMANRSMRPNMQVERLVRGLMDAMSGVSPDGCRVAYVVDPYDAEVRKTRLEVIDLCSTKR